MTTASTTRERVSQRVPLWRDVIVLKWATQLFLLAAVLSPMTSHARPPPLATPWRVEQDALRGPL